MPAATDDRAPIDVPAEVHEDVVTSIGFSGFELADEFTVQVAANPNGLLPLGAAAHRRTLRGGPSMYFP